MNYFNMVLPPIHHYYVCATGVDVKAKKFDKRVDAEIYMHECCNKLGIVGLEITEQDKHERKYSNHKGVRFYINRI